MPVPKWAFKFGYIKLNTYTDSTESHKLNNRFIQLNNTADRANHVEYGDVSSFPAKEHFLS